MHVDLVNNQEAVSRLGTIKLVLMDIDGTLITGRDDTLDSVLRQLKRLHARGIKFSIATGRTLSGASAVLRRFATTHAKLPAMVAYNGGVVAVPEAQSVVERQIIPARVVGVILQELRARSLESFVYCCDVRIDTAATERVLSTNPNLVGSREFNGMEVSYCPWNEITEKEDVIAILGRAPSMGEAQSATCTMQAAVNGLAQVTTSGNVFIEVAAANTSKLAGMRRLSKILHIGTEHFMTIGDNYNDLGMLQGAGFGVAVGNAPDAVKAAAAFVCNRTGAEGVVEVLRFLLDARRFMQISEKAGLVRRNG